jgi:hypothetical protein
VEGGVALGEKLKKKQSVNYGKHKGKNYGFAVAN